MTIIKSQKMEGNDYINTKKAIALIITGVSLGAVGFVTNNSVSADSMSYKIKKGDTLSDISSKVGQSYNTIMTNNPYKFKKGVNSIIYAGETLHLSESYGKYTPKASYVAKQPAQSNSTVQQSNNTQVNNYSNGGSAKAWIANVESTNNYNARNGQYYGRYQVNIASLKGDYSPANQERVAQNYVNQRYGGSWERAKAFHQANGWY